MGQGEVRRKSSFPCRSFSCPLAFRPFPRKSLPLEHCTFNPSIAAPHHSLPNSGQIRSGLAAERNLTVTCQWAVLRSRAEKSKKQSMAISTTELKTKIIESLNLQDVTPEKIEDDAPLFGTGLGLDSIDALELVVMLEKNYGIVIKDIEEGRPAFRSVRTLADFIEARQPSS